MSKTVTTLSAEEIIERLSYGVANLDNCRVDYEKSTFDKTDNGFEITIVTKPYESVESAYLNQGIVTSSPRSAMDEIHAVKSVRQAIYDHLKPEFEPTVATDAA